MKFKSKLMEFRILIWAIAFVDKTDLVVEGNDVELIMVDMSQIHNDLYAATGRLVE